MRTFFERHPRPRSETNYYLHYIGVYIAAGAQLIQDKFFSTFRSVDRSFLMSIYIYNSSIYTKNCSPTEQVARNAPFRTTDRQSSISKVERASPDFMVPYVITAQDFLEPKAKSNHD
jgi:hypothetical protein